MKTDLAFRLFRRRHQAPNRVQDRADFYVMFTDPLLELREFPCQVSIQVERLSQLHKGAHDRDVYLHRARAVQHAGKHGHAFFGEGIGKRASRPA